MKCFNRRHLLQSTAVVAVLIASPVDAGFAIFQDNNSSFSTPTWHTLPVGGGGFMRGMDIVQSNNTMLVRSDTPPSLWLFNVAQNKWLPLITAYSMPVAFQVSYGTNAAVGCWEARICPSLTTKFYMLYSNAVFVSTNSGGALWLLYSFSGITDDAADH